MTSTERPFTRLFNSRTKQITFFATVILGFALVLFMIYAILVTPSRQPYRDALAQYKNVYSANIAVITAGSSLNASSATDEAFTKSTTVVGTALDALEKENEALAKHDVLKDGEGKNTYKAFDTQLSKYLAFNRVMLASMQKVRPVIYACSQEMASAKENTAGVEAMRNCAINLETLEGVENTDYKALVLGSQKLYAEFAINLEQRAALADPEGADKAQYDTLTKEQESILNKLSGVSKTFSTNLNAHKQEVDITDAAMALDAYLSKKSSII